jgi:Cof subfamily protein (haloacid dehalogenase superfamily)
VNDLSGIRLIATDLDGTLLRHGQPIAPATVAAVRAALDAGIAVLPVTGRPLHWLDILRTDLPELDRVIAANGTVVYDLHQEQVLWKSTIAPALTGAFARLLDERVPDAVLAFETLAGSVVEPSFKGRTPRNASVVTRAEVVSGDTTPESLADVIKILVRIPGNTDSAKLQDAIAPLTRLDSGALHGTYSDPHNGLLELSPAGVTKAHTLELYTRSLQLTPEQVVAFGDMPNDIEMLRWAGTSFAMTGGHPDALAAATGACPELDAGGVAEPIRRILSAQATR